MDILITGGTGLLGQIFVSSLLQNKHEGKIYLIVRDIRTAQTIFSDEKYVLNKTLFLINGDISSQDIGLSDANLKTLSSVRKCYHFAACVHLGEGEKIEKLTQTVNLEGMRNLLSVLPKCASLNELIFVSSAYACGITNNVVSEEWHEKPISFRNPYELSKWDAEQLIKSTLQNSNISFSIIRPSILLDNNINNPNLQKQAIYLFAKIIYSFSKQTDKQLILSATKGASLNFVFVDELVEFISNVSCNNQSYNFVSEENIPISSLLASISEGLHKTNKIVLVENSEHSVDNPLNQYLMQKLRPFDPYFHSGNLNWVRKNTEDKLTELTLNMSSKNKALENIRTYCEMLQQDETK